MFDTQGHIDADSIGFALNEEHISSNLTTNYIVTICLFLYDVFRYMIFITALTILSWIAL